MAYKHDYILNHGIGTNKVEMQVYTNTYHNNIKVN